MTRIIICPTELVSALMRLTNKYGKIFYTNFRNLALNNNKIHIVKKIINYDKHHKKERNQKIAPLISGL